MKKVKYKILTKLGYLSLCMELEEIVPCIIIDTKEKNKDIIERMVLRSDDINEENYDKLLYELNLLDLESTIFLVPLESYQKKLQMAETFKSDEVNNPRNKLPKTEKDRIKKLGHMELQHDLKDIKEEKDVSFLTTEIEEKNKVQSEKDEKEENNKVEEQKSLSDEQSSHTSITEDKITESFINGDDKKKETEEVPPSPTKKRGNYKIPLTVNNVRKYYLEDNLSLSQCSETMGIPKATLNKFIYLHPELKKKQKNRESSDDSKEGQISIAGKYGKTVPTKEGGSYNERFKSSYLSIFRESDD